MQIREARPEDAPSVSKLSAELGEVLREVGNPVGAVMDEATVLRDAFGAQPAFDLLVAELDGEVAGYLLHHPGYDPDLGGRTITVVDLCVATNARRRGIGRALMYEALERCRRAGGHALVWRVRPDNHGARAFYDELGAHVDAGPLTMVLSVQDG